MDNEILFETKVEILRIMTDVRAEKNSEESAIGGVSVKGWKETFF